MIEKNDIVTIYTWHGRWQVLDLTGISALVRPADNESADELKRRIEYAATMLVMVEAMTLCVDIAFARAVTRGSHVRSR
jgi:hypothetical protein